jgi:hypothetical protein
MAKWKIPDTPSPEAILRAALERAASEAAKAGERNKSCPDGCKCADPWHIASRIGFLADDPAEMAAILEEAKKERG